MAQLGCDAFDFNNNHIRVTNMGGEPLFPAKDVCDLLGLTNPQMIEKDACDSSGLKKVKKSDVASIPHTVRISFPNSGALYVNVDSQSPVGVFEVCVML